MIAPFFHGFIYFFSSNYSFYHTLTEFYGFTGFTRSFKHRRICCYTLVHTIQLIPLFTHACPLTHSLIHSPIQPLTHPLTHQPTHPADHSPIHSLNHPPTHSLTHSPTYLFTHSPTHSFTHSSFFQVPDGRGGCDVAGLTGGPEYHLLRSIIG